MTAPGTRAQAVVGAVALLRESLTDLGGCEVLVSTVRRSAVQAAGAGPVRLHLTIEIEVDDPDEVIP